MSKRSLICIQQLPKPRSCACSCIANAAIDASSIQTSLSYGSTTTTIAKAQPAIGFAPKSLHWLSAASFCLSSTTTNCHGIFPLDEGATRPASIINFTSSGDSNCSVYFRMLRRWNNKSWNVFIFTVLNSISN